MIDPSLAPAGKHTLHAYLPATEPYELWEGLDRRSRQYQQLKEERSRVLWDGALGFSLQNWPALVLFHQRVARCTKSPAAMPPCPSRLPTYSCAETDP